MRLCAVQLGIPIEKARGAHATRDALRTLRHVSEVWTSVREKQDEKGGKSVAKSRLLPRTKY
jgi:hypothetical protein